MSTIPPTPAPEPTEPRPAPDAAEATPRPAKRGNAWLLPTLTGLIGLVLGAGLMAAVTGAQSASEDRAAAAAAESATAASESAAAARAAVLTDAVASCGLTRAGGIELGDGGASLTFDMKGDEDASGTTINAITCLFSTLDMPSAVLSHIEQTTAMDGRQTETWDNITVSWSYHPDRGLDGVLTVSND